MGQEMYRELWFMEGTAEDFEKVENFLKDMDFDYQIEVQSLDLTKNYSVTLKEKRK